MLVIRSALMVSVLVALAAVNGCAAGNQAAFALASISCGNDVNRCQQACRRGDRETCDVATVRSYEVAFETNDPELNNPESFSSMKATSERLCNNGITRACDLKDKFAARSATLNSKTATATTGAGGARETFALDQSALPLIERAKQLKQQADDLASSTPSDDDPDAKQLRENMLAINAALMSVTQLAEPTNPKRARFVQDRPVLEKKLDLVEKLLGSTTSLARRAEERKKAHQTLTTELENERPALDEAKARCTTDKLGECEVACKRGELMVCVALGQAMFASSPSNAKKAIESFRKACEGGVKTGCRDQRLAEKQTAERDARMASDFAAVESYIADIARMQQQVTVARSLGPGRGGRRAQAANVVQGEVERRKRDEFCPAKAEFIQAHGADEFARRAKEYCESDRVPAEGIDSGIGDTKRLRSECRQIVATACPARSKR